MHKPQYTQHPTDHAAFRRMIQDPEYDIVKLGELSAMIERDIVHYHGSKCHEQSVKEWMEKIKLIAEEIKSRRVLKLDLNNAA